jgi:hypothetical protein
MTSTTNSTASSTSVTAVGVVVATTRGHEVAERSVVSGIRAWRASRDVVTVTRTSVPKPRGDAAEGETLSTAQMKTAYCCALGCWKPTKGRWRRRLSITCFMGLQPYGCFECLGWELVLQGKCFRGVCSRSLDHVLALVQCGKRLESFELQL